jgi:SPP1 gp7 family putative phage head morphogenesis protein
MVGAIISAGESQAKVEQNLMEWSERWAKETDLFVKPLTMAHMAGQLFVRQIEVPEVQTVALVADPSVNFLALPFDEAIEAFLRTNALSREDLYLLMDQMRENSYRFASLMADRTRQHAFDLLVSHMRDGGSIRSFVDAIRAEEVSLGITQSSPGYLRNVYRTGIATSYGAGRYRQMTHPAVQEARPVRQYRAILDSNTRPNHAALHDKAWHANDSEWHRFAPPNGYQCRCALLTRRLEDVMPRDLARAPRGEPDPGFDSAPGLQLGT